MLKKSTLMLSALLAGVSISTARAQSYKPGYVVRPAGDTLRGFLQSRGALRNSLQCRFRPAPDAPVVEYAPTDLRAYALNDGPSYESQLTPPTYMADAEPGRRDQSTRTYFLEVLVAGRASLYTRRDANDETHYYLRMAAAPTGPVQELENRLMHRAVYARDQDQTLPLYRKTLSTAFQDFLAIQPLLPTLGFSVASLTDIVRRYNGYVSRPGAARPAATRAQRIQLSGGLVAGALASEMRFEGGTTLQKGTFKNSFTPTGGVFVNAVLTPLNERFHLRLEMMLEQLTYSNAYVAQGFSSVSLREKADLQWRSLRFPLQLRYHFQAGPVRPFVLAGVSGSFLTSSSREVRSEYTAGGAPVVTYSPAALESYIRSYEVGLFAGAGLALPSIKGHDLGLEVRGERSSGYIASSNVGAPIFRYSGLLSFSLF